MALGNHDYQNGKDLSELGYSKAHPESRFKLPARWYRLDLPPVNPEVTVLMLDSDKDALSKQQWADQKQWIDTELAKPRGTWTLCCAHHPLFSNGGHGDNGVLQKEWGPLLVKYNVDFYICGHDHDLQHLQIPNWFTSFLLVGGGGADTKLMRHDDRGPMSRLTHGFANLTFTGDLATVRYINDQDKTLHLFTRDKAGKVTVKIEGGEDLARPQPPASPRRIWRVHTTRDKTGGEIIDAPKAGRYDMVILNIRDGYNNHIACKCLFINWLQSTGPTAMSDATR